MSFQPPAQQCARNQADQVSLPYSSTAPALSFLSTPGPSILIDCCSDSSEGSSTAGNHVCRWAGKELTEQCRPQVIIDMLPDDVLIEIFDIYMILFTAKEGCGVWGSQMAMWQTLAHVCRRWRSVVFGSPRRLNLQLVCTNKTPTDTLGVWPALPLAIEGYNCQKNGVDSIIALLERSELVPRISRILLWEVRLKDISEAMEVPFPELTYLELFRWDDETEPVFSLSDSFLGGSAPRLQVLILDNIPFPGLPKLLSSATHLISLNLHDVPHSGYISPEVMVACFATLTSLDRFSLGFESPQSRPDPESRRPLPLTRTVLPILTRFLFHGDSEYLEALVACIDAPRLNYSCITFFNDIELDTPQFTRLISDTPMFHAFDKASVELGDAIAGIKLSSKASGDGKLNVEILCKKLDWQVLFLEQVCTSSLSPLSMLEDLYIDEYPFRRPVWENNIDQDIDNTLWVELLHLFTMVKNLFLSVNIAPRVMLALQELVGGRTTEVLPTLQNVFIEGFQPLGPVQEGVGKFVAARQFTSRPIVVSRWDRYPSPQVPRELDLSSDALRIKPEEPAQAEAQLGVPSPVTLAPKTGHLTATSEFLSDLMAAHATSTRPSEIDLSLLPEEGPTMAHIGLDPSLRSSADRPIELDLEGMVINMTDVDVSLSGDEPPNDIPTANPYRK